VVMSEGRVEQVGPPEAVYNTPASEFVATFLGASNMLPARCTGCEDGAPVLESQVFGRMAVPADRAPHVEGQGPATLVVRAEKLRLAPAGTARDDAVTVEGRVETVDYQGVAVRYFVRVGDTQLQAINMIDGRPFNEGEAVAVALRPQDCAALPRSTA